MYSSFLTGYLWFLFTFLGLLFLFWSSHWGTPRQRIWMPLSKHTNCQRARGRLPWQKDPGLPNTSPSSTRKTKRQDSRRFISNPSLLISKQVVERWDRDCRLPSALWWDEHSCPGKPTPAVSPHAIYWRVFIVGFNIQKCCFILMFSSDSKIISLKLKQLSL